MLDMVTEFAPEARHSITLARRRGARMSEVLAAFRRTTDLSSGSAEAAALSWLRDVEILHPEEEERLAKAWVHGGDAEARETFLMSMTGRLARMCMREMNIGEDYLDILNDAVVTMVDQFDRLEEFDRKTFRTGALLSVLSARCRTRMCMTRQVASPRSLDPRRAMASIMRFDFEEVLAGEISVEDIARQGQCIPGDLAAIRRMVDFFTRKDTCASHLEEGSHEEDVIHAVDARILPRAMREALDERAFDILARRWLSEEPQDAEAVGEVWGITPERVRQIERQSLVDLRDYFEGRKTDKMIRAERQALKIRRRRDAAFGRRICPHGVIKGVDLTKARPTMARTLTEREHEVISWRYFSGRQVMPSAEVASLMGLQDGRSVSAIERSALGKLQAQQVLTN